ncbi:restriction endonuclease subunit S [Xanthomonas oryzae]|uniref:restriction endonuclease subunit S n=1 Tax=Xanthomonas oryzae TaxID=347 RepID=UPI001C66E079
MVSELPGGWVELKLGDVVNYADNTTVQPDAMQEDAWLLELEDIERDSSRILAYETVGKRKPQSAKNSFHAGDVLYGKLRPYLNKVVRADRNGYSSSEIMAIKPNQLDGGYLFHYLKSPRFRDYVQAVTHGVRMPRLGTEQAKAAPFLLPPLAEQKRIAQKLDALLAQVDTLKARIDAIPALLKRFRKSVISHGVSGSLAVDQHASFDTTTWRHMRAEDVCTKVQSGGTPKEGFTTEGIPFLKVYNIVDGLIDFEYRPQYIAADIHQGSCRKSITSPGDVLMNIVGPPLGKIAVVPQGVDEWNINQAITLFRPSESISSAWIHLVLLEGTNIRRISQETKGSAGQVNISLSQCRDFVFPVPPTQIQDEIVHRVEQLFAFADQLEAKVAVAQQRIDALTQSLLAKAFRGELVPQDPSDEPASVLLDRIRAQRAAAPKPKRGRKAATS